MSRYDIFVASYSRTGELRWGFSLGIAAFGAGLEAEGGVSGGGGLFRDLAVDEDGNVFVTGSFEGTVDFDPGINEVSLTGNGADLFLASYDKSGAFRFVFSVGDTSDDDRSNSIALDRDGNAYITGSFRGTADFDPGDGVHALASIGRDAFVASYDGSGGLRYAFSLGGIVAAY